MFSAVLFRLRRTIPSLPSTLPDLEHDAVDAAAEHRHPVFVSGIIADRSRPVLRAVDYLRAQGYHELVPRSTVILNHTDSITDKGACWPTWTERFCQGRNRKHNGVRSAPGQGGSLIYA